MGPSLDELRRLIQRHATGESTSTAIPGVEVRMGTATTDPMPVMYSPMACFVLQGAKRIMIGSEALVYSGESYMLLSVDLPATGQVIQATADVPYIAVSLALDSGAIAGLLIDMPAKPHGSEAASFAIGALTPELADPLLRLMRLLDHPGDIAILAPLVERELLYRLLQGPQGAILRELALADSRLSQIRRAIEWIRRDVTKPLSIEWLATHVGMSGSAFHRHFKAVTGVSPLQYQKQIRLHEARRRLLTEPGGVTTVAFAVGYESTSQFNREYTRQFGMSPGRDAARLRLRGTSRSLAEQTAAM